LNKKIFIKWNFISFITMTPQYMFEETFVSQNQRFIENYSWKFGLLSRTDSVHLIKTVKPAHMWITREHGTKLENSKNHCRIYCRNRTNSASLFFGLEHMQQYTMLLAPFNELNEYNRKTHTVDKFCMVNLIVLSKRLWKK
jgi:hypothetical protein